MYYVLLVLTLDVSTVLIPPPVHTLRYYRLITTLSRMIHAQKQTTNIYTPCVKMYQDFAPHTLTHSNKDNNDRIKTVRNCKNAFWSTVESCVDDWNIQHSQNNLSHHVLLFNIICLLLIRGPCDNSWKRESVLTKFYFCLSSGETRTKNLFGYFGHLMDWRKVSWMYFDPGRL